MKRVQCFRKEKLKKFIKIIADERKLSQTQYYQITNDDLYDWIITNHKTRFFTKREMKRNREYLPLFYRVRKIKKDDDDDD